MPLEPSAKFEPYIPASTKLPEFTFRAVLTGAILGMVFGASSLYLALKVGLTVSASIPIAVLSIVIFKAMGGSSILENNIVQTTGSAGESIAAGVVFTLPALVFLGFEPSYWRIVGIALAGGWLGVLFMIPLRRYLMILVLTPMMLSFVAVGAFFRYYYDPTFGLVSQAWKAVTGESLTLLATPAGAMAGIVFADSWMWSPFVMLLVLAGLVSVPRYLYEAAEVDRASWWRKFRTITFPYIRGLLMLALLFRTIEAFKLFDVVYLVTQGGPGTSTETIAVYVYRVAFQYFRTSQSTALAYILLFIVIVLTNLYLYLVRQRSREA